MGKHYIKEWRRHRGLTQEAMCERLGLSKAALSRVESGAQQYSQRFLEDVAEALNCSPADLIVRDPNQPDGISQIWEGLGPEQREQLVEIARTLRKPRGAANDR